MYKDIAIELGWTDGLGNSLSRKDAFACAREHYHLRSSPVEATYRRQGSDKLDRKLLCYSIKIPRHLYSES